MLKKVFSILMVCILLVSIQSCHKSYVWGKKDAASPTKFRSDTKTIKGKRR